MKKLLVILLIVAAAFNPISASVYAPNSVHNTPPIHPDFAQLGTAGYINALNRNEVTARALANSINAQTQMAKGASVFMATVITAFLIKNFIEWYKKFEVKSAQQELEIVAIKAEIAQKLQKIATQTQR